MFEHTVTSIDYAVPVGFKTIPNQGLGRCGPASLSQLIYGNETRHSEIRVNSNETIRAYPNEFRESCLVSSKTIDSYVAYMTPDYRFFEIASLLAVSATYLRTLYVYEETTVGIYCLHTISPKHGDDDSEPLRIRMNVMGYHFEAIVPDAFQIEAVVVERDTESVASADLLNDNDPVLVFSF